MADHVEGTLVEGATIPQLTLNSNSSVASVTLTRNIPGGDPSLSQLFGDLYTVPNSPPPLGSASKGAQFGNWKLVAVQGRADTTTASQGQFTYNAYMTRYFVRSGLTDVDISLNKTLIASTLQGVNPSTLLSVDFSSATDTEAAAINRIFGGTLGTDGASIQITTTGLAKRIAEATTISLPEASWQKFFANWSTISDYVKKVAQAYAAGIRTTGVPTCEVREVDYFKAVYNGTKLQSDEAVQQNNIGKTSPSANGIATVLADFINVPSDTVLDPISGASLSPSWLCIDDTMDNSSMIASRSITWRLGYYSPYLFPSVSA